MRFYSVEFREEVFSETQKPLFLIASLSGYLTRPCRDRPQRGLQCCRHRLRGGLRQRGGFGMGARQRRLAERPRAALLPVGLAP